MNRIKIGSLRIVRRFNFKEKRFMYILQEYQRKHIINYPESYFIDSWNDINQVSKSNYINYKRSKKYI